MLEYYPTEKAGLNISLKMEQYHGWWSGESYERSRDRWNTDLMKFYFVGEQGQDVILTCIAGGEWINTNQWRTFPFKIYRPDNPAKSLEMIEAHTCDLLYSSSASNTIQFKICKNREHFKDFESAKVSGECCETNGFGAQSGISRNSWASIDTIEHDGGEALGNCEGFELTGKAAHIAIQNNDADKGCFGELKFYGAPGGNGSSIRMPFVSCAFKPVWFDSLQTRRHFGDWTWRNEQDDRSAIYCAGDEERLSSLEVGVCDWRDAGSYDTFTATICGKNSTEEAYSDCCTTGKIERGKKKLFKGKALGSCRRQMLKPFLSVKFYHPRRDGMCIDYIKFNRNPICETCHWTDSGEATKCTSDWKNPIERRLQCDIGPEGLTIKKLWIKVCNNEIGGMTDELVVYMENDRRETCKTLGLAGFKKDNLEEFSPAQLGPNCSKFQVTETTHIWLYTEPGNDDLCLTDLNLDVSSAQTGVTRSVRCRFDHNKKFEVTIQGGDHYGTPTQKAIPLKCT